MKRKNHALEAERARLKEKEEKKSCEEPSLEQLFDQLRKTPKAEE